MRWPQLQNIPRFTDETGEVATAIAIAWHGAHPLVHNDAYRGPWWAYALGGVLAVAGPRPGIPRAFAMLLGIATVGATYLLGRSLSDRRGGAVAALLMATAFSAVVLNSHVAWSNNATPLWVTLALVCLVRAAARATDERGGGAWLIASSVLWAVAVQSHPSAVAALLGAAAWFFAHPARRRLVWSGSVGPASDLERRRPGRPTRVACASAGAALLVMSPLLAYNLQHHLAGIGEAFAADQPVAVGVQPAVWLADLSGLAGQLGRAVAGGPPAEASDPTPSGLVAAADRIRPLVTAAWAALLLGALARAAVRGPSLIAASAASSIGLITLVNRSYLNFYDMRYLGFLLPLAFVAVGTWASCLLRGSTLRRGLVVAATIALAAYPLLSVRAFYDRELAAGRSNAPLIAAATDLGALPAADRVFIDKAMRDVKLGGGGDPTRAFAQLLTLTGKPGELSDVDEIRWHLLHDSEHAIWIVGADRTVNQLASEFELQRWRSGDGWTIAIRPR